MTKFDNGADEAARRIVLAEYPTGQLALEGELDGIARLAAQLCDAPVGLVSIVEQDRQVFVGRHGTALSETPRDWSFCAFAMHGDTVMEVGDARLDSRFADNPLVTGAPDIRFYAGQPLRSPEGLPLGSLCVIDTAARPPLSARQRKSLETLATAVMALLERWRVENRGRRAEARSQSMIADLEQRFQILADAMPQLVWATLPDGSTDYFNSVWCAYTGEPVEASLGEGWFKFLHPDDLRTTAAAWAKAVTTGGIYDVEYRLRRHDGEYRWMLARGLPMRGADGSVTRWIGTCTDVHVHREAAERLDLLSRELSHRIKNIFAVIGGLISMTVRRRPDFREMGAQLQERILALGRAHDFVRPHSDTSRGSHSHSSLQGMLEALLAPYSDAEERRIMLLGDDVRIDDRSATALALFFHELATNAAKYGGLSVPQGQVRIWITAGESVGIHWVETGGPPPQQSTHHGFGATLVEMSVVRQLGGTITAEWHPEGLRIDASIPAAMMSR